MGYKRHGIFAIENVVEAMLRGEEVIRYDNVDIKIISTRMRTYTKGTTCVSCGKKALFFAVEQSTNKRGIISGAPHFNLYGENNLLFTSDHIMPASLGGDDVDIANRQCMCSPCNARKGNTYHDKELLLSWMHKRIADWGNKILSVKADLCKVHAKDLQKRSKLNATLNNFHHNIAKMQERINNDV